MTAKDLDRISLAAIVKRQGVEATLDMLKALAADHQRPIVGEVVSPAFMAGAYDDPNPLSYDQGY